MMAAAMARGKAAVATVLSDGERDELEAVAPALPARIFLMAAEGATNTAMADRLGIGSQLTAGRWRKRFARAWADGRFGAPRPGAPRTIGDEEISASIRLTLQAV
jgi:hypothetical protein